MDKFAIALILVMVSICVLDVASTTYILYLGGHELNPYMVSAASDVYTHTLVKVIFVATMAILAICCEQLIKGSGMLCPVVASCAIGYAVFNNLAILYQNGYIQVLA